MADRDARRVRAPTTPSRPFDHRGDEFSIHGEFNVPRSPQGYPVQIQAGDSDGGRELAAAQADVIFSRHSGLHDGQAFYADVKGRLARYGRQPRRPQDHPGGDRRCSATPRPTPTSAPPTSALQQVSPQGAIAFLEQVWGRDLSAYDPDGPLPDVDPDVDGGVSITRGRVRHEQDPLRRRHASGGRWPRRSSSSIRQLIIEVTDALGLRRHAQRRWPSRSTSYVQADAADGYILVPHLTPHGLDEFVDKVVPVLQERGVFRADYEGPTLRDHLGLARPASPRRVAALETSP